VDNEAIFPSAFEKRMRQQLGPAWDLFKVAHRNPAPVSIRINPRKGSRFSSLETVPWSGLGRYLPQRPVFTLDPLFHGGAYYVQEASSMFLEQVLSQVADLRMPLRILDLSAAPGGKSTHVLSLISDESLLVSNEVIRSRASVLAENIQKWGYANCLVTNNDPADFAALPGFFDVIIVDAPCSGEGLFRKDKISMTEWSQDNVAICASRQKRILHDIWPSLKENGVLIYSTCTYSESENETNLLEFSRACKCDFIRVSTDPSWNITEVKNEKAIAYREKRKGVKMCAAPASKLACMMLKRTSLKG
jgi:16S rRNA C967 or C1407 C5-methylase (RsmB/RsmF family)